MARYEFGSGIGDFVVQPSDGLWGVAPGVTVTFWSAADGGTQYTDLLDATGAPVSYVTSTDDGALPSFFGPDGVTGMWADAGGDSRAWMASHTGQQGAPGVPGAHWLSGAGAPDEVSGLAPVEGDVYVDNLTGDLYFYNGGAWVFQTSIRGPEGLPGQVASVNDQTGDVHLDAAGVHAVPEDGGTVTGPLVINPHEASSSYPIGQGGAVESVSILSSFAGGEDEGQLGQFDSTGRLNLYSYQRADVGSYGETIRHFAMRKDSKQMEAWYFPSGGYDVNREPVGSFKPVVWAGAHWEANNHASNHKHWSVETPSSTGSIETRFEIRFGDPTRDDAIAGLDKTLIATNLADFVVRCTNGQEMRLTSPNGQEKKLVFSRDAEGNPQWRRWAIRSTDESETGANAGSNFQLVRYDDAGVFQDNPIVVSRSTGNVSLGPGFIARRSSSTVSSLSLNTTSLGGGVGVLAIGNANTIPAGIPTGGGVLYAEGGALKWKGSSGTVTTIAPA